MSRVAVFAVVYIFTALIVVAMVWGLSETMFAVWNIVIAPAIHLPHEDVAYFRMVILYVACIRGIVDSAKQKGKACANEMSMRGA